MRVKIIAAKRLDSPAPDGPPALDNRIFERTENYLYCIQKKNFMDP